MTTYTDMEQAEQMDALFPGLRAEMDRLRSEAHDLRSALAATTDQRDKALELSRRYILRVQQMEKAAQERESEPSDKDALAELIKELTSITNTAEGNAAIEIYLRSGGKVESLLAVVAELEQAKKRIGEMEAKLAAVPLVTLRRYFYYNKALASDISVIQEWLSRQRGVQL